MFTITFVYLNMKNSTMVGSMAYLFGDRENRKVITARNIFFCQLHGTKQNIVSMAAN